MGIEVAAIIPDSHDEISISIIVTFTCIEKHKISICARGNFVNSVFYCLFHVSHTNFKLYYFPY